MIALRPNESRARVAIVMIWVVLGAQVLGYISEFMQLRMLNSILAGNGWDMDAIDANDNRQLLLAVLGFVALIVSAVTFIMWFRRAYYNLSLLDRTLSHTDGWAAGAWFVPILSLFRPFQIMREMFVHTNSVLRLNIEGFPINNRLTLLGWWWALWIISNIWGNISFRIARGAETFEALHFSTSFALWEAVISVPLAILAFMVIKEYAGMERLLVHLQEEEQNKEHFVPAAQNGAV
jgi:hypothetical protein